LTEVIKELDIHSSCSVFLWADFFLASERFVCLLNVSGLLKNFAQEFWSWNLFKELIHSNILIMGGGVKISTTKLNGDLPK